VKRQTEAPVTIATRAAIITTKNPKLVLESFKSCPGAVRRSIKCKTWLSIYQEGLHNRRVCTTDVSFQLHEDPASADSSNLMYNKPNPRIGQSATIGSSPNNDYSSVFGRIVMRRVNSGLLLRGTAMEFALHEAQRQTKAITWKDNLERELVEPSNFEFESAIAK
jgi:hypothetical protein